MNIVIKIDENVFTRLFDNGIEDYTIMDNDLFAIATAIRKGKPLQEETTERYKPIILQEHDAEPRTMRAILDTATDEIYICKLTRQGAEILGMTIEETKDSEKDN